MFYLLRIVSLCRGSAKAGTGPSYTVADLIGSLGRWRAHTGICASGPVYNSRRASLLLQGRLHVLVQVQCWLRGDQIRTVVPAQKLPLHREYGVYDLLLLARHGAKSLLASSNKESPVSWWVRAIACLAPKVAACAQTAREKGGGTGKSTRAFDTRTAMRAAGECAWRGVGGRGEPWNCRPQLARRP